MIIDISQNHIIMEWFGLEGPLEAIEPSPPAVSRDIFTWIRVLRAPSNLAWNVLRDGASTTSLGNLGQGLTTLTVKNFFYLIAIVIGLCYCCATTRLRTL